MWKRARPEDPSAEGGGADAGLGDESEAFLRGEWPEYLRDHGETVPRWAWLNRVAHGSEEALRRGDWGPARWGEDDESWTECRSAVTETLLNRADETGRSVDELQLTVLVPIELALFARNGGRLPADAFLLVRILSALRHPSTESGPRAD